MLIRLDEQSDLPLYDQIAAALRGAIADGIEPGSALPPARELARGLGVNMHTVLRAYGMLREEGLIELRRGRGAVVTGRGASGRAELHELVRSLVGAAGRQGMSRRELADLVERWPSR